jgi:hypothetical protein
MEAVGRAPGKNFKMAKKGLAVGRPARAIGGRAARPLSIPSEQSGFQAFGASLQQSRGATGK